MTRKLRTTTLFLLLAAFAMNLAIAQPTSEMEAKGADNLAYKWGKVALMATANDTETFKPRPTITSRYLGLIFTAVFDAWTRYDEKARPLYLKEVERRPSTERTLKNKEIAISFAAYRAMSEYYFKDNQLFRKTMMELGLDPDNQSLDPTTPEGIGNLAALRVIEARRNDGSNQYGNVGDSKGVAYYDYSNYIPVNTLEEVSDLNRWQPKVFADGKGGTFVPKCLTPFWIDVEPLVLESGDQFRPIAPPAKDSEQLKREVKEVIDLQANLTDEQIALVEFMRDGPKSVQQAGHWLLFAQEVSIRDHHTLDDDVKMYFLNQAVAMDAFIAAWDSKMHYDYGRPIMFIREMYKGETITGWKGPGQGFGEIKGEEWIPYSPDVFPCPPFPGYVSGHSCISGGCAEALRLFTGSDEFHSKVDLVAKSMTEPDHLGEKVTLEFPTFTETAEMAGISRVLGGYHIQADNVIGLELGRNVAREVFRKFKYYIGETDHLGTH